MTDKERLYQFVEKTSARIGRAPFIGYYWGRFWFNYLMRIPWVRGGWMREGKKELRAMTRAMRAVEIAGVRHDG